MNENDFRIVVGVQLSLCIVEFYRVKILGFSREGGGGAKFHGEGELSCSNFGYECIQKLESMRHREIIHLHSSFANRVYLLI